MFSPSFLEPLRFGALALFFYSVTERFAPFGVLLSFTVLILYYKHPYLYSGIIHKNIRVLSYKIVQLDVSCA